MHRLCLHTFNAWRRCAVNSFTTTLYSKLQEQLYEAKTTDKQPLKQASRCIRICRTIITELKEWLDTNPFAGKPEEIVFFKEVYPAFYARYIYYVKIFVIETNRPAGSDRMQARYLQSYLSRINYFFDSNIDFYQYYRMGATHLDEIYFIRDAQEEHVLPDDLTLAVDSTYCTVRSYKAAKLIAYELLQVSINNAIHEIEKNKNTGAHDTRASLQWTGPKVALIEMIYALQGAGVFNNATADIKQLTTYFEHAFNIELGNVYNTFLEMRLRKKNRSAFIDLLKDRLIQRMDEADERY